MATKLGDITLEKKSGTTLTLMTDKKYVDDNVLFNLSVIGGTAVANTASADTEIQSDDSGRNISEVIGNKATSAPSSGYYIKVQAAGSGSSKVTSAGWIAKGNLPAASTTANNYYPIDAATVTQNVPTVNSSGLVTATTTTTAGYTPANATVSSNTLQLSTQAGKTVAPTESEQTVVSAGKYTTGAVKIGAISPTYVGSQIPKNNSDNLSINENVVTASAGYYADDASKSVPVGTVTSGTATISSVTVSDGSDASKFALSGSANVSAPTVGTAGYVSSTKGTKNAKSGGATLSATVNKIVGSASISATTKKPSITKQATPSGVTNAASGDATTIAPSSGIYVAVKSAANTATLTPTVSITTSGYGTSSKHGITASGANVGAAASDTTYIPITEGSTTMGTMSIANSTGIVTAPCTVAEGYQTASTPSKTLQLTTKAAATYNTSTSDQSVAANRWLTGAQTIKAVTTSNIDAANIKDGVNVKVGDANSAGRIKNVTGTFTDASTVSSGQTAAAADKIRSGYSAWVDGAEVKGSLANTSVTQGTSSLDGTTLTRGEASWGTGYISSGTIAPAVFANEATSGVDYLDISSTADAPVLVSQDYLYINKGYTDNLKISLAKLVPDGSDVKGHGNYILKNHSAYDNDGTLVAGTIESLAGGTKYATTSDQTISCSGKYMTSNIVIGKVITSGISAANIKYGTTIKVGDAGSATRNANVAGTFTKADTVSSGQVAATASQILSGYSAWVDAQEVQGSISTIASSNLQVSGKTVTVPLGYYTGATGATAASASVAVGTVTSGTASITSVSVADGTDASKFSLSGSADVSAPSVGTAGYISSSEGTRNKKTGGATLSATVNKIVGTASISATTKKPSITKQNVPSGVTQAASGDATTTAPSSGVYVAVKSAANTATLTPTVSITTSGYGTSSKHGITASGASVGAAASDTTYIPIATTSATVNGKTVSYGSGWIVGGSKSVADVAGSIGGTAASGKATAAISNVNSMNTITDISGKTAGTDYWTVKATASTTAGGYTPAYTVTTAGWLAETVTGTKQTVSVTADTTGKSIYIPKATIAGSSTNATATTTVAPGAVTITKQDVPSGVTQAASGNATTTAPTSGVYVAVLASAAANTTGTTSAISGSGTATVGTAGYAPTSLTGSVSVSGTATAKTSKRDSSVTYVPITTASPSFKGGAVSGTATASSSTGASLSTTTNSSGITIAAAASATRAKIQYNAAVNGWVSKAASTDAYAASSATALTGTTYYLNGATLSKPTTGTRTFTVTAPDANNVNHVYTFTTDTTGRTTIGIDSDLTIEWNATDASLDFVYS